MIPNLASRPFLNTRPVWLVTVVTGILGLIFIALNVHFYIISGRTIDAQIERRDRLSEQNVVLEEAVREDLVVLRKVPWRSLKTRVEATNLILHEHAFSWVQMLDDLGQILPWDVRIVKIAPKVGPEEATLTFDVLAQTRLSLLEFLDNLVDDPRFSQPTPANEITPETSGLGYRMTLKVMYHPDGEES